MKIGHRGAAGYAPENTIKSIKTAIAFGVDGIEFDVQLTKDDHLILCHDASLKRTTGDNRHVSDLTLAEIRTIRTRQGEPIPSLIEALKASGTTPVIIEVKSNGAVESLIDALAQVDHPALSVASFHHGEMKKLLAKRPDLPVFLLERTNPIEVIQKARSVGASGIGLNYWILNPLTYALARKHRLDIFVYTVNNPLMGGFIHRLYPDVRICTNFPDRIVIRKKIRPRNETATGSPSTKPKQQRQSDTD